MVYKNNIPLANDKFRISQADVNTNFGDLDSIFDVDHVKFSDATGDAGKHVYSTYVNLTDKVLSSPTTTAQELALYVKDDAAGEPRIFYQEPDSAGAGAEQQLSGSIIDGTDGEAPLAGGFSIKWGRAEVSFGTTAFTYAGDFSLNAFVTDTYSLVALPTTRDTSTFSSAISNTGFSLRSSSGTNTIVHWIAIGK